MARIVLAWIPFRPQGEEPTVPRRLRTIFIALATFMAALALGAAPAAAATNCVFVPAGITGTTMLLTNDCFTDQTIFVPNGVTLDGNGHTIEAANPAVGDFNGAVVRNDPAATEIHVTNLRIEGSLTVDQCDAGDDRLRGIMLDRASGTITNTEVVNIRQGQASGCQEGNAIEARSFDVTDEATDPRVRVTISDNLVQGYQKTGILANGGVDAVITRNVVIGDGPVTFIAQNGIQVGFGATALISANTISGNNYTPTSFFACGIIVVAADGVDAKFQDNLFPDRNDPLANEKDYCGFQRGGNYEPFGR